MTGETIHVECCFSTDKILYYVCSLDGIGERKIVKHADLVAAVRKNPGIYDVKIKGFDNVTRPGGGVERLDIGDFYLGEALYTEAEPSLQYQKRDAYGIMEDYLTRGDLLNKVGIVSGMRNTGKTVILMQLACSPVCRGNAAYITLNYRECDVAALCGYISTLYRRVGIRYFFIDEVTRADGFVDYANGLADKWTVGKTIKIVLSGTDSLSFALAKQESLHHRYIEAKTTPMGYREYSRLTGKGDVLDYIRSGGVFWENKPSEAVLDDYLRTSVVENIYNTIHNMRRAVPAAAKLMPLSKDGLHALCYSICRYGVLELVRAKLGEFDDDVFAEAIKDALGSSGITVTETGKKLIRLSSGKPMLHPGTFPEAQVDAAITLMEMCGFLCRAGAFAEDQLYDDHELVFAQTGVAREFVRVVLRGICLSGTFPAADVKRILGSVERNSDGLILESACMSAVLRYAEPLENALRVFKYRWSGGEHEIDICVLDRRDGILHLHEIKRTTESIDTKRGKHRGEEYAKRHLADADCVKPLVSRLNPAKVTHTLLYCGKDETKNIGGVDVRHRNIAEFLVSLENGEVF